MDKKKLIMGGSCRYPHCGGRVPFHGQILERRDQAGDR